MLASPLLIHQLVVCAQLGGQRVVARGALSPRELQASRSTVQSTVYLERLRQLGAPRATEAISTGARGWAASAHPFAACHQRAFGMPLAGSVRSAPGWARLGLGCGRRPLCAPPPSAPRSRPTLPSSPQPPCGSTPLLLPPSRCPLSYPCSLPTPGCRPVPCPCSLALVWPWLQPVLGVGPG